MKNRQGPCRLFGIAVLVAVVSGSTAYSPALAWANPNMKRLEQQALVPMIGETPVELVLAGREGEMPARLSADSRYVRWFADAFPNESPSITLDHVVKAIASFERTLISGNSGYDRAQRGDTKAMSASAKRGAELFFSEKMECFHCHGGFNFTGTTEGRIAVSAPRIRTGMSSSPDSR